jgi:transcriptional regulator with XRE-family HTH domain
VSSQVQQAKEAFGVRLREIRKDANLSGRALATATGMHFTKVSRLEHGKQNPSEADVRIWCHACTAEEQIPDLIATLRSIETMYLEWRRQLRTGLRRLQESSLPLYDRTRVFRVYEHTVFPGLLHTADYAAALLAFWVPFLDIPDDLDAAVAARMERQRVLYGGDHQFMFLLAEQVLRTRVGTTETMLGQLDRLLSVMSLPRVSVGIIPAMALRDAWAQVPFWVFDESVVKIETVSAGLEITQPREVNLYVRMFDQLRGSAVHGPQARELIASVMNDFTQLGETS